MEPTQNLTTLSFRMQLSFTVKSRNNNNNVCMFYHLQGTFMGALKDTLQELSSMETYSFRKGIFFPQCSCRDQHCPIEKLKNTKYIIENKLFLNTITS